MKFIVIVAGIFGFSFPVGTGSYMVGRIMLPGMGLSVPSYWAFFWATFITLVLSFIVSMVSEVIKEL